MKKHNLPKCNGKASFASKTEAMERLDEIKDETVLPKKPVRAYRCDVCSFWHLTSMSIRFFKRLRSGASFISNEKIERLANFWINKKGWNKRK